MGHSARRGFTLIELVVVVSILLVLAALLLSGVQKVREVAIRTIEDNNLHQLGIAVINFHSQKGEMPRSLFRDQQTDNGTGSGASSFFHLRPFMEQDRAPVTAVLPLLSSPFDPRSETRSPAGYGLTSYAFVEGVDFNDGRGIVTYSQKVRSYQITDGASTTVMIGPRPPAADLGWGWWGFSPFDTHLGTGNTARVYFQGSLGPCPQGQARFAPGNLDNVCDFHHFWSPYVKGGTFAMGDGSIRFFEYSASSLLLQLATRSGKEHVLLE
jgi:prepilin-type N-terminal cleavage/methylation domain-containing protein